MSTKEPVNCDSWSRFSLLYITRPQQDHIGFGSQAELSFYSKVLLLLYGQYKLIENKDSTLFPEMYVWFSEGRHYLMETFNVKLSSLIESGIQNYQNHYLILRSQLKALDEFLKASKTDRSWSRFSLVNKLVSNQNAIGVSFEANNFELLFADDNSKQIIEYSASLYDLKVVWVLYLFCIMMSMFQYILWWLVYLIKLHNPNQ